MFKHKRVYCLHKFGHCFLANKYLKILVLPTCSFDYIAMIRPLHNKLFEFILMNDQWEIDSMTLKTANIFGIDPQLYQLIFGDFKGMNTKNIKN